MKKVLVGIEDCKPGMQMAQTVFNEYGVLIVPEDAVLDNYLIDKMKNLDIPKVNIYEHTCNEVNTKSSELITAKYKESINDVKEMFHDISSGKDISIEKVNSISESIAFRINENSDIITCINQIKNSDEYTYTHSVNVAMICMLIGKWMKYDIEKIKLLVQAALLHDIGKIKVPSEILNKPAKLTDVEFVEMRKHPVYGYRIVDEIVSINSEVKKSILMHHEREDGTGYPVGLKSSQINEFAKIIPIADIYDAMTSNRVYKLKDSPFEVFDFMENKVFGVLNQSVVHTFLNNIATYYIGNSVKLSTGDIGEIVYINPLHISQPIIKVGEEFIDLTIKTKIKVLELL